MARGKRGPGVDRRLKGGRSGPESATDGGGRRSGRFGSCGSRTPLRVKNAGHLRAPGTTGDPVGGSDRGSGERSHKGLTYAAREDAGGRREQGTGSSGGSMRARHRAAPPPRRASAPPAPAPRATAGRAAGRTFAAGPSTEAPPRSPRPPAALPAPRGNTPAAPAMTEPQRLLRRACLPLSHIRPHFPT